MLLQELGDVRYELGTPLGTACPSAPCITATLPAAPTGRAKIFPVLSPSELTVLVRARAPSPPPPAPARPPHGLVLPRPTHPERLPDWFWEAPPRLVLGLSGD